MVKEIREIFDPKNSYVSLTFAVSVILMVVGGAFAFGSYYAEQSQQAILIASNTALIKNVEKKIISKEEMEHIIVSTISDQFENIHNRLYVAFEKEFEKKK